MSKYKILLPKTGFPLRNSPPASDVAIRAAANFDGLYKWQLENRVNSETFVLHDGPPYANGDPHMGHALNKILKDIINRYKLLRGYRVLYRPGWDCHGLPIELKACKSEDGNQFVPSQSPTELRSKAASFARTALSHQKDSFKSWGCLGDWDNPYLTMNGGYESDQLGVFYDMYKKGCIYRGFKPVYWSPSTLTALAESELQYTEHVSKSVHILFPLAADSFPDVEVDAVEIMAVIWTTTPWTLIANKAICYNPDHSYSLVKIHTGEYQGQVFLLGTKSLENISSMIESFEIISTFPGSLLEGKKYHNPMNEMPRSVSYPFLPAEHVAEDEGTGLVHTAPAHGHEDYAVGVKHGLSLSCNVDQHGNYTSDAGPEFEGKFVLGAGNTHSIELLKSTGSLLEMKRYTHRYPCDWRSRKPVIVRATEQWFANVRSLVETARRVVKNDVSMYPANSLNRFLPFLEGREEWCISRQRSWGVPLPVFYRKDTNEPLITEETVAHVRDLVRENGTDCWWTLPVEDLLPTSLRSEADCYQKGEDTMDVWFDSGTSWASVLKDTEGMADMYLEGNDQHRGWFLSSLLTSVAVRERAPYRSIVTHGFVLDKSGDKMSKSLGNVTSPDDVVRSKKLGADVLRMWVASSNFTQDVQLTDTTFVWNQENVRKVRNSCRFLLGNLADFDVQRDLLSFEKLSKLDRYLLHLLRDYSNTALKGYDSLSFSTILQKLLHFISFDLSAFHFYASKDRLYCEAESSHKRRSAQTTLYHTLLTMVKSFAPVLPHLAEEVCQYHPFTGE